MILRLPTENENGGILHIVVVTPFPLTGKGRDRGAREPAQNHHPYLCPSPFRGRIRTLSPPLLNKSATDAARPQFSKEFLCLQVQSPPEENS